MRKTRTQHTHTKSFQRIYIQNCVDHLPRCDKSILWNNFNTWMFFFVCCILLISTSQRRVKNSILNSFEECLNENMRIAKQRIQVELNIGSIKLLFL